MREIVVFTKQLWQQFSRYELKNVNSFKPYIFVLESNFYDQLQGVKFFTQINCPLSILSSGPKKNWAAQRQRMQKGAKGDIV